ncbi:alpha-2-macroglobulin [Allopusillimonas soli]|uniref:Alpha-2-macroglobulin n=1 Tax=Allopusillimonas soli TaxID=659016 RepID=A0A853F8I1_9BURK|nr:MG2 domain-containing protein [Allopusillimonas soli]NYT36945.1 alpha-2-macroglobulin [Allopusillimonas soli]TEA75396.1 alpha-2-macroglobulin [Allopusillimonas soli]
MAARIVQFSPQGTVALVNQVAVKFDQDVIAFGDGQSAPPMQVQCNDAKLKGHGRWLDARSWVYAFEQTPGPGVKCTASLDPTFRSSLTQAIDGATNFSFQTGGPVLRERRPYGGRIAEDQIFALTFNGDVDPNTLEAHTHCLVEGLGEAVPVRLVTGETRRELIKAIYYWDDDSRDNPALQLVQCKRTLPADAQVRLVVDAGVATPAHPDRPSIASTKTVGIDYQVRPIFSASMTCLRENASMPCTPVSTIDVLFSAPIAFDDAARMRLKTSSGDIKPVLDEDGRHETMTRVSFEGPFPPSSTLTLTLPDGLKDDAGRLLANADQFPLQINTAAFPPLVKFSASPFGVIERFANVDPGQSEDDAPPAIPLTVRSVEADLLTRDMVASAGKVSDYRPKDDRDVLRWYARINRLESRYLTPGQISDIMHDRKMRSGSRTEKDIDVRGYSALADESGARKLQLPGAADDKVRPFEVIGVPLPQPGFHVLEIESPQLGASLLGRESSMYVRTTALVTNLAVHIKSGRDDTLAWVTTLDEGKVVADAQITVLDCHGTLLAQGRTDKHGIWHVEQNLAGDDTYCSDTQLSGIYVSARIGADHPLARGKADFAFALSSWDDGIESWRFNVPTDFQEDPTLAVHTVYDRTLLRAGETVSMKHYIRVETRHGLAAPDEANPLPDRLIIEHQGSGQRYEQPVSWIPTATGGMSSTSSFAIPESAHLGGYYVRLTDEEGRWYGSSEFRVEEFKLPLLAGNIQVNGAQAAHAGVIVAPDRLNANVQVHYVSGGPAAKLPVSLSGVMQTPSWRAPEDYDDYSFSPPADDRQDENAEGGRASGQDRVLFLDKRPVTLDAQGAGHVRLDELPPITEPRDLLFEASFFDPNGELQTLAHTVSVWPAAVQAGIKTAGWVRSGETLAVKAVALRPDGEPSAGLALTVSARQTTTYSVRKRMVGGFYSYDNHIETHDLGTVCEGSTAQNGILECNIKLDQAGSIELVARVRDEQGRISRAASRVWVSGADELWFGGDNDDRIDIIPARKAWKPGETAEFQVRMPFRHATALVAVEREGVLETHVVQLDGKSPNVRLPVKQEWGPNVYVSVLALRGRIRDVPWQSFFTWGWRAPMQWYKAFTADNDAFVAPTPFVDLSKPAFRFGVTEIRVTDDHDRLTVKVSADQDRYQIRDKVHVKIKVTLPDGKPAANGTVAFAAVDEALLELAPNRTWDLLSAMRGERSYGVRTATAQMQVVGRRHYGRKALPAGGGGGLSATRELLDTLLIWEPSLDLDENGEAELIVPLNDALTRFRMVAVADYGVDQFGTGSMDVVSTQDLQVIPGLPALVREGDQYKAMLTLRNTTERDMHLQVTAKYAGEGVKGAALASRNLDVAAGSSQTVSWDVSAPHATGRAAGTRLSWTLAAVEQRTGQSAAQENNSGRSVRPASDSLRFIQTLQPAVPVQTRQATLLAINGDKPAVELPVAVPEGAITDGHGNARGGLRIHVQSSLAGSLPAVQAWFEAYPYTCLEQQSSKAMGLLQTDTWAEIMRRLPDYLDEDGLASYFPGARYGSEVLTAYMLMASDEATKLGLDFSIPSDYLRRMQNGLLAFVQGKLQRHRWSPVRDLYMRKLAALEALSRYEPISPRLLDSIQIDPDRWPTSAVIDWMAILRRTPSIADAQEKLAQAGHVLRARMAASGTALWFADDVRNNSWWMMSGPQSNLAKLMLVGMDDSAWSDDMPKLALGLLSTQDKGAWRTTTANLLGSLALKKFAHVFEKEDVTGSVRLMLGSGSGRDMDWVKAPERGGVRSLDTMLPWGKEPESMLTLKQQGDGTAWASIQSLAAVPVIKPISAGYGLEREITPVSQAVPGKWTRGDVYRVRLEIRSEAPMNWVVLSDPIPAGATVLGSGLGRDSSIATMGEQSFDGWYGPSFVERSFEAYRAYFDYLPKGISHIEYTVRLNTAGQFALPPTRIEALYQPDLYAVLPQDGDLSVQDAGQAAQ